MKSLRYLLLAGVFLLPLTARADPSSTTPSAPAPVTSDTAQLEQTRAENAATPPAGQAAEESTEAPPDFSSTLTGDWGGFRTRLAERGVSLAAIYHADFFRNFSGGIKTGNSFLDDLDVQLSIDGEKLFGVEGLSMFFYGLNNDGSKVNENLVGSAGGIDNIEAIHNRPKLFEAWVQQNFFHDKLSLLGGLYDINTEFDVTDSSLLFLNPAFGLSTEFATTGRNGPSTFPQTSAGGRVLVKPLPDVYVQAAVLGGNPADPGDPDFQYFGYGPDAHLLLVGEAGYRNDDNGHYGIGVWRFTGGLPSFASGGEGNGNGGYVLADRVVWTDAANKDRKLAIFGRAGLGDPDTSPFHYSWQAGFNMANFIPARKDSQFGIGISQTGIGNKFRHTLTDAGEHPDHVETQLEATYADKPLPWLTVQPDLQYTIDPLADSSADNAWTGGVRMVVNF